MKVAPEAKAIQTRSRERFDNKTFDEEMKLENAGFGLIL
jgi:hypothetical protein